MPALPHRPEIDGLRAVAVLPVIFFHAGFAPFAGGYAGVDVFFVISGYLITSLLARDIGAGTFSLARFYERRARRLLPALFLVLAVTSAMAWAWMLPAQLEAYGKALAAVALFAANLRFWLDSGYFAPAAELNPLLHTWSLSVEEQFYLFFPPLLLLLLTRGRRLTLLVLGGLCLASLALAEAGSRHFADANFFLIPSRLWELGAGALCALVRQPARPRPVLAASGLLLIAGSMVLFDAATPFPSLLATAPVLGTCLVLVFSGASEPVGRLLAARLLVGIGLVSYSAYLWHQPLFAFARIRSLQEPSTALMLGLCALTLGLAWLTWKYVETPVRRGSGWLRPRARLFRLSAAGLATLLVAGVALHLAQGASWRLPPAAATLLEETAHWPPPACGVGDAAKFAATAEDCATSGQGIDILMYGDSHVGALVPEVLRQARAAPGLRLTAAWQAGCIPIPGLHRPDPGGSAQCRAFNAAALRFARERGIKTVVIGGRWPVYYEGEFFDNGEGGVEHETPAPVDTLAPGRLRLGAEDDAARKQRVTAAIHDFFRQAQAAGIHVIVIGPIPEAGWHVPQHLAKTLFLAEGAPDHLSTGFPRYVERTGATYQALTAGAHPNVTVLRPEAFLCNREVKGRCLNARGSEPYYLDDDHLSNAGARLLVGEILRVAGARTASTRQRKLPPTSISHLD